MNTGPSRPFEAADLRGTGFFVKSKEGRLSRREWCRSPSLLLVLALAFFPVLPHDGIVTMGFVCPRGIWDEQQETEKEGDAHRRTVPESMTRVKV